MADWIETTNRLIQDESLVYDFLQSDEGFNAFMEWASKTMPEEYGND